MVVVVAVVVDQALDEVVLVGGHASKEVEVAHASMEIEVATNHASKEVTVVVAVVVVMVVLSA